MAATSDEHPVLDASGPGSTVAPEAAQTQEEDMLRDVLDELDRERSKRAELEAQVRKMATEHESLLASYRSADQQLKEQEELIVRLKAEATAAVEESHDKVTPRAFTAMETQVSEYQVLVDELTKGKPAIAAAAATGAGKKEARNARPFSRNHRPQANKPTSLPLYVVRLLEILPWTPHAHEHVFAREEIFEWQFYDRREQQWTSNFRTFPQFFKALPVVKPENGKGKSHSDHDKDKEKDRGLLLFLAGGAGKSHGNSPTKHAVLTNEDMTHILSIDEGYPLPEAGGSWEWIGGWRIEKRVFPGQNDTESSASLLKQKVDCDADGWSYAQEAEHFKANPTELVWDNPGQAESGKSEFPRNLRRRKWTRQRVLVDYPHACEQTKQYLKLLADNARLTVTTNKVSDQLVETKTALTENEEVLMRERSDASAEIVRLQKALEEKTEQLRVAEEANLRQSTSTADSSANPIQDFIAKNEQMKGLGSKISQWVKSSGRSAEGADDKEETLANVSPSTDENTEESSDAEQTPSNSSNRNNNNSSSPPRQGFDWKKVGGGRFFQSKEEKRHKVDKNSPKSTTIFQKFGESPARNSLEGSSTDESVEELMQEEEEEMA